jgi:hypothetical protein
MFRNVVWERLICIAGAVAALGGHFALGELAMPYTREPLPGLATNTFGFFRAARAVMFLVGGVGWYFASGRGKSTANGD